MRRRDEGSAEWIRIVQYDKYGTIYQYNAYCTIHYILYRYSTVRAVSTVKYVLYSCAAVQYMLQCTLYSTVQYMLYRTVQYSTCVVYTSSTSAAFNSICSFDFCAFLRNVSEYSKNIV